MLLSAGLSQDALAVGDIPTQPVLTFLLHVNLSCLSLAVVTYGFRSDWVEPMKDPCFTGSKNENAHLSAVNLGAIILLLNLQGDGLGLNCEVRP